MRNDVAREPERRVRGIVCGRPVPVSVFIPALRDVPRTEAGNALHFPEQVVEHVAPVAQHVEDDSAAVLHPVIPRRPLRGLHVTLEDPVAKLAADREYPAEETGVTQRLDLQQSRQPQLVLHHSVPNACMFRRATESERLREGGGHGLLALDVFPCGDGPLEDGGPYLFRAPVKKNLVSLRPSTPTPLSLP